jgi:hypothetical protein
MRERLQHLHTLLKVAFGPIAALIMVRITLPRAIYSQSLATSWAGGV